MIEISVVVPSYNRPAELRRCLQGFAQQTASREAFEVVIVDDGSPESMEPVAMEFADSMNVVYRRIPNSGPSAARNTGLDSACAPYLVLYDDDLVPRPAIIEHCLEFHRLHPGEEQMELLWFRMDPAIRNQPLHLWAFPRLYPFPGAPGVYDWRKFWSGTLSCKKSIFRFGRFHHEFRAVEDTELALRLTRRLDLQVHFARRLTGLHVRPVTLASLLSRSHSFGYYEYRLARQYPGAYGFDAPFEPEKLVLPAAELETLIAAIRNLLSTDPQPDSPGFRLMSALCNRAYNHARAEGWRAARDGSGPELSQSLHRLLV